MPLRVEQRGVRAVVGVARVAAVDDQVARLEHLGQLARRSARVGSPEGTITQTTRGAVSAPASAASESTSVTSGRGS